MEKTPLYLQTDIGGDIDDFWALTMLLRQSWLDLRMILTDTGNTIYRAAICAKLLQLAGRDDVFIGAGHAQWPQDNHRMSHLEWVRDYPLASYGNYTQNGVEKFVEMVLAEQGPITLVAIGPAPSLAAALRMAPEIAGKINFVGMFGSVYRGYNGKESPDAEYNVRADIEAAKTVFAAKWLSAAITPLDTCGLVVLDEEQYGRIAASNDPLVKAIVEVYDDWRRFYSGKTAGEEFPPATTSSILFDTVAVHMATSFDYLDMEEVRLVVDDGGYTRPDPTGRPFMVAKEWKDLPAFERFLVDTLLG